MVNGVYFYFFYFLNFPTIFHFNYHLCETEQEENKYVHVYIVTYTQNTLEEFLRNKCLSCLLRGKAGGWGRGGKETFLGTAFCTFYILNRVFLDLGCEIS